MTDPKTHAGAAPVSGIGYLKKGFDLIRQPGLRRFAILPVIVNVIVFSLVFWLGYSLFGNLMDRFIGTGDGWWTGALRMVLWLLILMVGGAGVFFGFTALANIVGAPFNGFLAEAVERRLSGKGPPSQNMGDVLKTFPRIMLNEARKVIYFAFVGLIVWIAPMVITGAIPGLNVVVGSVVSVLFLAWMNAVEYIDYPMSARNVAFKQVRKTVRSRRWLCLGFGGAVLLCMAIPVLNLITMPAAVAGATALWHDHFRES